MAINQLCADGENIQRFITEITKDWHQFCDQAGKFEIRCLGENRTPITQIFTLEEVAASVDFAIRMNTIKLNVYMMINPINPEAIIKAGKGARKENILRAHYSFADADDRQGLQGLTSLADNLPPDIHVTTGTVPYERSHAYWKLAEPCYDMNFGTSKQAHIADQCDTDRSVKNPSRIMRLPGTVSYPSVAKQTKGYMPELVTMKLGASGCL
jgi:hypothetical protein